uniref:Type II secretion system protein GspG C-terminal domain-containing protein n=1 Tax=uncultured Armatimonadetes bacterium TaxID=157466 RepID=A0A6J4K9R5_9BACT|nr:hypothetical protein AVDCRST_MAG63-5072 [uncultured Armatimonadetes bacterium]
MGRGRGRSRAKKGLLIGGVVVAGLALWAQAVGRTPQVVLPVPTPLPRPNAYDFSVKAGEIEVRGDEKTGATTSPERGEPVAPLDARLALLKANTPALRTLRQGFAHPYRQPPVRSFDDPFGPDLAKMRALALLLTFEGGLRAEQGDAGGAANSYLDAVRFGVDLPNGGPLITGLVGVACEAIGRQRLWEIAPKLSAKEARAVTRRLEQIEPRRTDYADTLLTEKHGGQATMLEQFRKKGTVALARELATLDPELNLDMDEAAPVWETIKVGARLMTRSRSRIFRDYSAYMDALVARARQPYAVEPPAPPAPDDPMSEYLAGIYDQGRFVVEGARVQEALLTTHLVLLAYRAERGTYPASLDALVRDGYLARVPDDPFAPSGPLRYRRVSDTRCVLYSVGPDGRDDGGTAIDDPAAGGSKRHRVEVDSRGDIVARVNTG